MDEELLAVESSGGVLVVRKIDCDGQPPMYEKVGIADPVDGVVARRAVEGITEP